MAIRVAVRQYRGIPISPFGENALDLRIMDESLGQIQERILHSLGLQLVEKPPLDEAWLSFDDDLWFTRALLQRFLQQGETGGQLAFDGIFREGTQSLQDLDAEGRIGLAIMPVGVRDRSLLPVIYMDLEAAAAPIPWRHAIVDFSSPPWPITAMMAHRISHWTHLLRVNLLALIAHAKTEQAEFEKKSGWRKLGLVLGWIWKARSLQRDRIIAAVGITGSGCKIHPTAVVENSILGPGVVVGAGAIVRGSWIGENVQIGEQTRIAGSVIHSGAVIARGANLQGSVLLSGAYVSAGNGHQLCLFGRDCFVAAGVTTFDLSFGRPIHVWYNGTKQSTGTRLLGSCIGHRARIGPHVRIGYGQEIPNDAWLIGDPDWVVRNTPHEVSNGKPWRFQRGFATVEHKSEE